MPGPLIIPGPDGDDLYDANAAAAYLGVSVSTLRMHQYQDRGGAWPMPEDPEELEIHLPDGAGLEWARAIDELMLRAGGAGHPVTLWRKGKLDAFRLRRSEQTVPLRDGVGGPQIGEAVIHGDGTVTASVTDEGAAARIRPDVSGISVAEEDDRMLLVEQVTRFVAERLPQAIEYAQRQLDIESEVEQMSDEETATVLDPQPSSRPLTAKEVLERARLRREGKL